MLFLLLLLFWGSFYWLFLYWLFLYWLFLYWLLWLNLRFLLLWIFLLCWYLLFIRRKINFSNFLLELSNFLFKILFLLFLRLILNRLFNFGLVISQILLIFIIWLFFHSFFFIFGISSNGLSLIFIESIVAVTCFSF